MRKGLMGLLMVGVMAAGGGVALAAQHASVSADDKAFMEKAAQGGMEEVDLGKLAETNAESRDVKGFGQRMVKDHGKANQELMDLAKKKGVSLPKKMEGKPSADAAKLKALKGEAFDRAYMSTMVKDHVKDVKDFEDEAKKAKDKDLKAWVDKTLPTLKDHLAMAEHLDKNEKAEGHKGGMKMEEHKGKK